MSCTRSKVTNEDICHTNCENLNVSVNIQSSSSLAKVFSTAWCLMRGDLLRGRSWMTHSSSSPFPYRLEVRCVIVWASPSRSDWLHWSSARLEWYFQNPKLPYVHRKLQTIGAPSWLSWKPGYRIRMMDRCWTQTGQAAGEPRWVRLRGKEFKINDRHLFRQNFVN